MSLADGFPFLLITDGSLAKLNSELESASAERLPMNRFRRKAVAKQCRNYSIRYCSSRCKAAMTLSCAGTVATQLVALARCELPVSQCGGKGPHYLDRTSSSRAAMLLRRMAGKSSASAKSNFTSSRFEPHDQPHRRSLSLRATGSEVAGSRPRPPNRKLQAIVVPSAQPKRSSPRPSLQRSSHGRSLDEAIIVQPRRLFMPRRKQMSVIQLQAACPCQATC